MSRYFLRYRQLLIEDDQEPYEAIFFILMIIFIFFGMLNVSWTAAALVEHLLKVIVSESGSGKAIPDAIISVDGQKIGQADSTDTMGVFGAMSGHGIAFDVGYFRSQPVHGLSAANGK